MQFTNALTQLTWQKLKSEEVSILVTLYATV